MARMLGFGRPTASLVQYAFLVEDLAKAIEYHVRTLNIGPFFILPGRKPPRIYRGMESATETSLAMAFSGNINVELIEMHDEEPSIFLEGREKFGFGFHHHGMAHEDVEAVLPTYFAEGFTEVSRNAVPTGGEVVFLEPPTGAMRGFLELIPANQGMDATFTRFWQAAQDWDGTDPIRPFVPAG